MASSEDYGGKHRPPGPDGGAPLHDLTGGGGVYPDDVYGPNAARYYGHGEPGLDRETVAILHSLKGRPDAKVRVYRAVPDDLTTADKIAKLEAHKAHILRRGKLPPMVQTGLSPSAYYNKISEELKRLKALPPDPTTPTINAGDWVTVNRNYAKQHGETTLKGQYKILSKMVLARDVFTNGDSIHEAGYWPREPGGGPSAAVEDDARADKGESKPTQTGPRGGVYYMTESGAKVYVKK